MGEAGWWAWWEANGHKPGWGQHQTPTPQAPRDCTPWLPPPTPPREDPTPCQHPLAARHGSVQAAGRRQVCFEPMQVRGSTRQPVQRRHHRLVVRRAPRRVHRHGAGQQTGHHTGADVAGAACGEGEQRVGEWTTVAAAGRERRRRRRRVGGHNPACARPALPADSPITQTVAWAA